MNAASSNQSGKIEKTLAMLGRVCGLLLAVMIVLQFSAVAARYLFSYNFLWLQELVIYLHAAIILCAAGWTFSRNKHIRLDVLSNVLGPAGRRRVDHLGTLILLVPTMLAIIWFSKNYIVQSWTTLEGSAELSGLPGVFIIKTLIFLFAVTLIAAGVVVMFRRDT